MNLKKLKAGLQDVRNVVALAKKRQVRDGTLATIRSRECIVAEVRGRACKCGRRGCPSRPAAGKVAPAEKAAPSGAWHDLVLYSRCSDKADHLWADIKNRECPACGADLAAKKRGAS